MAPKLTEKEKNQQIKKEALISAGLYIAFFIWCILLGTVLQKRGRRRLTPMSWDFPCGFLKLHRGIRAFFHRYDLCRKEVLQEF